MEANMAAVKKRWTVLLLSIGVLTVVYFSTRQKGITINEDTVKLQNKDGKRTILKKDAHVQRIIANSPEDPRDIAKIFKYEWKRKLYEFNITRSIEVSVNRTLPSTVPKECSTQRSLSNPLTVSIIIPFYAEHWTILLRILHCVFNTVPDKILHQVILVDDANDEPNFGAPFEQYLVSFSKVSLIHLKERHGLIKARMEGARAATGDVLVFIDAHVEMEEGWIEPLLRVIARDNTTVAVPRAASLDVNTLKPVPLESNLELYGSFTWELDFYWMQVPGPVLEARKSTIEPIPTATMIGCAFAVHRQQFFHLGGFDEGMVVWGGENLELSFRTWMCGGRVVLVPCSVTYHIYRAHLPYDLPSDTMYKNLQRLAFTWMDEYKQHYFHSVGRVVRFTPEEQRSLTARQDLKKRLKCRDFTWFLQNIAPNILEPPRLSILWGQLKNLRFNMCIFSDKSPTTGLNPCPVYQPTQTFYFNTDSELVHQKSGLCLTNQQGMLLTLEKCKLHKRSQTWNFSPIYPNDLAPYIIGVEIRKPIGFFWLVKGRFRLCLDLIQKGNDKARFPGLRECETERLEQYWLFTHKINDHVYFGDVFGNE